MAKPIGVQLYSVREALPQDFEGVIRKIASFGYNGVEPYNNPVLISQAAADLYQSLGLEVPSSHSPLPLGDQRDQVLEAMRVLGCKYLVCPHIPPEEYRTVESTRAVCQRLNQANAIARDAGLTLVYHNHWFEYEPIAGAGTYPYKIIAEEVDPSVRFEVDTYWVKVPGLDPVAVLHELGARVPLVHLKDGPADKRESPMTAVGAGKMDIPAIVAASQSAEWLIVEIDRCATDMLTAIQDSYRYLVEKGFASGKQS